MTEHAKLSTVARDHADRPRNYGPVDPCDGHARITGACGDTMEFWLRLRNGHIEAIGFTTTGCGTSRAAGSMTSELARGQSLEKAEEIDEVEVLEALGGLPVRSQHCALLATNTLLAAIEDACDREKTSPWLEDTPADFTSGRK
jgi:nitrogen fixation NifU-like protein